MLEVPSCTPQSQYMIPFLDPRAHDFYLALGYPKDPSVLKILRC